MLIKSANNSSGQVSKVGFKICWFIVKLVIVFLNLFGLERQKEKPAMMRLIITPLGALHSVPLSHTEIEG